MPTWLTAFLAVWGAVLSTILGFNQLFRDRPKIDIKLQIVDETRAKLFLRVLNEHDYSILVRRICIYPKGLELDVIAEGEDMRAHHFSALAALEGRTARRIRARSNEIFTIWRKIKSTPKNTMPRKINNRLCIKIAYTPGNGLMPVLPLLRIIEIDEYDDLIRAATMESDESASLLDTDPEQRPW